MRKPEANFRQQFGETKPTLTRSIQNKSTTPLANDARAEFQISSLVLKLYSQLFFSLFTPLSFQLEAPDEFDIPKSKLFDGSMSTAANDLPPKPHLRCRTAHRTHEIRSPV